MLILWQAGRQAGRQDEMKADGKLIEWQAGIRANRPLTDTVAGRHSGKQTTDRHSGRQALGQTDH